MFIRHKHQIMVPLLTRTIISDIKMNIILTEKIRHNSIKIERKWVYRHTDRNNEDDIIYNYKYINT